MALAPKLFAPDKNRPFLFTAVSAPAPRQTHFNANTQSETEVGQVIKLAHKLFELLPGFTKIVPMTAEKLAVLHFDFPDRAAEAHHAKIRQLAQDTGWCIDISPKANPKALGEAVKEAIPSAGTSPKSSTSPDPPVCVPESAPPPKLPRPTLRRR